VHRGPRTFQWNWCTLSTPVDIVVGQEYVLGSVRSVREPVQRAVGLGQVHYMGLYYCFSSTLCYREHVLQRRIHADDGLQVDRDADFPDAGSAEATLDINNVAPSVTGVTSSPNPGLEGSPTQLEAEFSDPGLDDTWEFRWNPARRRVSRGSRSRSSTRREGALAPQLVRYDQHVVGNVRRSAGTSATKTDVIDFGPLGTNSFRPSRPSRSTTSSRRTNYFTSRETRWRPLANYMDAGGNIVQMQFTLDNAFGCDGGSAAGTRTRSTLRCSAAYSYGAE